MAQSKNHSYHLIIFIPSLPDNDDIKVHGSGCNGDKTLFTLRALRIARAAVETWLAIISKLHFLTAYYFYFKVTAC